MLADPSGMPRLASCALCALVSACGSDTVARSLVDAAPASLDDATPHDGATALDDARVVPEDGALPDAPWTPCDEATLHSDFAWIEAHILVPSCATAGCHTGAASPAVGLRLDAGVAYANLVDKGASTVAGWIRVVPGSIASSYLAVSLGRADGPPPRDGFMPLGADPLCVEKLEAIERWIVQGAPP